MLALGLSPPLKTTPTAYGMFRMRNISQAFQLSTCGSPGPISF